MANIEANGINIAYDTFGDASCPPILLIIGLGGQLIDWDDALCQDLAAKGLYVMRFDNRDSGLTTQFRDSGVPQHHGGHHRNPAGNSRRCPLYPG